MHAGANPGYRSYAFFNPKGDFAVVVLSNPGPNFQTETSFADRLAQYIEQRPTGEPAISLAH